MRFKKTRLMTTTVLCVAALLTGTTMLGAASPDAIQTQLAAEEETAAWTLDADGTLTISDDIRDQECPWKDQAEQIKKVVFTKSVYFYFREAPFEGCVNLTSATLAEAYEVRGGVFKGCTALTDVTIPEGVSTIGYNAFEGCTALKTIQFPESLTHISDEAFRGCTSLDNLVIPEKCYGFGSYAFADCTSLTTIENNGAMNVVGRHVFENTPWLKAEQAKNPLVIVGNYLIDASACTGDVVLPDGLEGMGGAFADTDITSVVIPESCYNINTESFMNCTGLTEVKLPSELNALATRAFAGCTGLTHIEIPDTVTVFTNSVFAGCTNLKSVKLPNNDYFNSLSDSVFKGCSSLESIEIPVSVTRIGNSTFAGCEKLTEVTIPQKVSSLDSNAFEDCTALETVTLLNPLTSFSLQAFPETIKTFVGYKGSSAELVAEEYGAEFRDLGIFVGGPIEDYGKLSTKNYMKILKPGESFELGDDSRSIKANIFVTGTDAKIAEVEYEVEDLADLSFTQDELTYTTKESSLYQETSYNSWFYNNNKPVNIVNLTGKFTIKDTIKSNEEDLRIVFTKLVDENGTDLLADTPDHKVTLTYEIRMYTPVNPKPTEPTTEPTEAVTEPETDPVTEPTEAVTEPETDPVTELATDPTEPATDPENFQLGNVNGDAVINASDAAVILIAAAAVGAGNDPGLTEAQKTAADVNKDKSINASDAAVVLIYSAAVGAGKTDAKISDYVH